ncbi:MAG TPA: 2-dehydropantoate 2-reductase [Candidatus Acidoferrum sp.]|nr:2-dehydropantoate 2-reductase [Candidatus Acidoferrum sp.]
MKIGIVGAGAIGLTFAAALASTNDVLVLARRREVADAIEADGIALVSEEEVEVVPVRATLDPAAFADRDAVLVAVKAHATRRALEPLRGNLASHALVVSLQNGLDNDVAAREALPEARVVAGTTTQAAIALGPGRIRPAGDGTTTIARDIAASPTSDELGDALLTAGLDVRVVDDIRSAVWEKVIVNVAVNPLGALTGRTNGALADDPDLAALARALATEAAAVASAEGISIANPWRLIEAAVSATAANRNSMLQDLDAGRPTEIDAIGAAIVRRADAHGIAVPLTKAIVQLIRARERA